MSPFFLLPRWLETLLPAGLNYEPAASSSSLPGGHQQGITRFAAHWLADSLIPHSAPTIFGCCWFYCLAKCDGADGCWAKAANSQWHVGIPVTTSEVYMEAFHHSTTHKATRVVWWLHKTNHSWDHLSVHKQDKHQEAPVAKHWQGLRKWHVQNGLWLPVYNVIWILSHMAGDPSHNISWVHHNVLVLLLVCIQHRCQTHWHMGQFRTQCKNPNYSKSWTAVLS